MAIPHLRGLGVVLLVWVAGLGVAAAVGTVVLDRIRPEPLPPEALTPETPSTQLPSTERTAGWAGSESLIPGTCISIRSFPDQAADQLDEVPCDQPHTVEVFAQLPGSIPTADQETACRAAATAAGVPQDQAPVAIGATVTPEGTLECSLTTPEVTGSVTTDGYRTLIPTR